MGISHTARRSLLAAITVLLIMGAALTLWPVPKAIPLLAADGWLETQNFAPANMPSQYQMRKEAITNPAFVTWRSWSPDTGNTQGILKSKPFTLPGYLLVPFNGTSNPASGLSATLLCVSTSNEMPLALHRTNTDWSEVIMKIDPNWCPDKQAQLIAKTTSTESYISLGTPFEVSALDYYKVALPALIFIYTLLFGLLALPFVATAKWQPSYWLPVGATWLAINGMGAFFAFWAKPIVGFIFIGISCVLAAIGALRRRALPADFTVIMVAWFVGGLFFTLFLYSVDNGLGAWSANGRFLPAAWSSDNQLPIVLAQQLVSGQPLEGIFGNWQVSDRPPLLAGLFLFVRSLFGLIPDQATSQLAVWFGIAGIIANSFWIGVLIFGARLLGMTRTQSLLIALLAAFAPFILFNSVYGWPKLLGGALALIVVFLLLKAKADKRVPNTTETTLCALLCAGALLSHGGTIFGVVVIGIWALTARLIPSWKSIAAGIIAGLAMMLPWMLWQHIVEPPGNALMKFAFAGTFGFGQHAKALSETVKDAYAALPSGWWLQNKLNTIVLPFWPTGGLMQCGAKEFAPYTNSTLESGFWRVRDYFQPFASLGLLIIALPFALLQLGRPLNTMQKTGWTSLLLGFATVEFSWLITWGCPVMHHQSYQALLMMLFGLGLLILNLPRWQRLSVVALTIAYSIWVWMLATSLLALRLNEATAITTLIVVAGAIYWIGKQLKHGDTTAHAKR